MFDQQIAREAPAALDKIQVDSNPDEREPLLKVSNIQGNIAGFSKDHQTMLFLKITNFKQFKNWLQAFVPFVATAQEVLHFNRLFKEIRSRRGAETRTVQSTWINIAFSFDALDKLTDDTGDLQERAQQFDDYQNHGKDDFDVKKFKDEAFRDGMAKRAVEILGDPQNKEAEGNPHQWVFGGFDNEPHAVIIIASDSDAELDDEVERIEESIYSGRTMLGKQALSGAQIVFKQHGATLPPPLTGHEHFGFLDGVSQPGLRGKVSNEEKDFWTPRQNSVNREQGKPGQDLLYPGEFIFGYRKQAGKPNNDEPDELNTEPTGDFAVDAPIWAKDGSFLVVRRLRQEVAFFHEFLKIQSQTLQMSAEKLGAKLVGRWASGAPVMREPDVDNRALGDDDCANNNFEFNSNGQKVAKVEVEDCSDEKFQSAVGDTLGMEGLRCPFAGHIRKAYPRDDEGISDGDPHSGQELNENTTQTHRLLRRGIPFGNPYFPPANPEMQKDSGNRGLLFASYQTSIVNQFEFVQRHWANNPEFKLQSDDGKLKSGHDFIIGQSNHGGRRNRRFVLPVEGQSPIILETENDWVIPTGGGYFFQPSIDALCLISGKDPKK